MPTGGELKYGTRTMPQGQIVLDLETQKTFDEVEGRPSPLEIKGEGQSRPSNSRGAGRNPAELGITVVGVYSYATDQYRPYLEEEIPELEQLLSNTTRVIGFNIKRFDFPVLQPYLKRIKVGEIPYLDLMEELEKVLGHRVSLQSLVTASLNASKSGSGLDAVRYYRNGEMEKLKKYCLDDVRLTKDLYEFGKRFGCVHYLTKDGSAKLTAKISWKDPAPPSNLSLF